MQGDIDGVQIMRQGLSGQGPPAFEGFDQHGAGGGGGGGVIRWLGKFWLRMTMCTEMPFTVSPSPRSARPRLRELVFFIPLWALSCAGWDVSTIIWEAR